jgi:hypothetical protein
MSAMRSVSPATRVELKLISEARNHARSGGHSRFGDCQALANAGTSYVVNASKLLQQEQLSEQLGISDPHRAGHGDHAQQHISQLIRPTSSCAGTPETTTPACGESPKQSLP